MVLKKIKGNSRRTSRGENELKDGLFGKKRLESEGRQEKTKRKEGKEKKRVW